MVGLSPECKKNDIGLVFDINKKDHLIKQLKFITTNNQLLKKFQTNAYKYGKTKKPSHAANLIEKNLLKYEI